MRLTAPAGARRGMPGVTLVLVALALLAGAPAARAAVIGDPGPRTLQVDSSSLTATPFGLAVNDVTVGPSDIALGADGTFAVPSGLLAWGPISGTLVTANSTFGSGCDTITLEHDPVALSAVVGAGADGAGALDPQGGTAQIGFDAVFLPAAVSVEVDYSGQAACAPLNGSTVLSCSTTGGHGHVDLANDPLGSTDLGAGDLDLSAAGIDLPATWACTGGASLGSFAGEAQTWLQGQLGFTSPAGATLALTARMIPGAHGPPPDLPAVAPPAAAPPVASPRCHRRKKRKRKKKCRRRRAHSRQARNSPRSPA